MGSAQQTVTPPAGSLGGYTGNASLDGAVTINDSSADVDFRVESDANTHALFVEGSTGNIGIGTSSPPSYGSTFTVLQANNTASGIVQANNSTNSITTEIESEGTRGAVGTRTNHAFVIKTNQTERIRILSGGGLTFNGDTATANALNDYEEGTYDVTMTPGTSGSITVRSDYNTGGYIKIGNLVSVYGYVVVTSTSSPSGYIQVNLPFAVTNTSEGHASAAIYVHIGSLSGKNTNEIGNGLAFNGQSYFRVYSTDSTGYGTASANALTSSSFMYFGGSYRTG